MNKNAAFYLQTCWSERYLAKSLTVCPTMFRMNPDYLLIYYNYLYTVVMAGGPLVLLIILNAVIIVVTCLRKSRVSPLFTIFICFS